MNLPGFPVARPRRLRTSPALRRLVAATSLNVAQLVLPLFARSGKKLRRPVDAMPGVFQLSPDEIVREAAAAHALGVPTVLLFGIPDKKDAKASGAYAKNGIVQQTVRLLKKELPSLLVITDVCLCEYMEHGHCGIVSGTGVSPVSSKTNQRTGKMPVPLKILNDPSLKLLAQIAVSHAEAGADIIAPSDMMDGRVATIRAALDKNGFTDTPIMSYAAKFASAFYGPFREAAESAPKFGDRRSYQMDPPNGDEAMREVALDLEEGADIVMVKPALPYLDLIWRVKQEFNAPVAAYNVSGEYSMIRAAGINGWIDEERATLEVLTAIKRAGADLILTYFAKDVARKLRG